MFALLALAGCASAPLLDEPAPPLDETLAPVDVRFHVTTRASGATEIAGLAWLPATPSDVVVLAIHGSGGVKEFWGPLNLTGYSVAHEEIARGRALVAIDMPGYGSSPATTPTADMIDRAMVAEQVSASLRAGDYSVDGQDALAFARVFGLGHSLGGLTLDMAQARSAPFDGIVVTGWGHGGFSSTFETCATTGPCPETADLFFDTTLADASVVAAVIERLEPGLDGEFAEAFPLGTRRSMLSPQDVFTREIRSPVLVMLGDRDALWDPDTYPDEASRYPGSANVEVMIVPEAGHFLFHHRSRALAMDALGDWLDERSR